MNATSRLGLLGLALALSACSVLESDKIDYKSAKKGATLEVPPDLSQLSRDTRYTVPGGQASAVAFEAGQAAKPSAKTTSRSKMQSNSLHGLSTPLWCGQPVVHGGRDSAQPLGLGRRR